MMQVRKVSGALGAELSGVDLSQDLPAATVAAIRAALLEHGVIFFRDQPLAPAAYMRFAEKFGQPVEYPLVKGLDDFPMIIEVKKLEHEKNNFGGIWHSDTTYLECPPMGSMLLAREIPPFGGDTLFANQVMAWDALSDGLKKMLRDMKGISSSAKADVSKTREDRIKTDGHEGSRQSFENAHPVARVHPETGKVALFVNVAHTTRFDGWTAEESAPLLDYLFRHQVRPEFTCRFAWQPASLAFWDNRSVQHNPVNDYHGYRRLMHRITLAGDRPA